MRNHVQEKWKIPEIEVTHVKLKILTSVEDEATH